MILKNKKTIQFIKELLLENDPIKISHGIFFFPNKKIGFFSSLPSKGFFQKIPQETVWITSKKSVLKKEIKGSPTLYFLKKEKTSFKVYDRRYLKTKNGLYLLPPVQVTLQFLAKTPFLKDKEKELFFPERKSTFYCLGDTTYYLKSPLYLQRLEEKNKERKKEKSFSQKAFLFLKNKLDV